MVENKQYLLIVVSVQSGRFFPKRSRWKVSVEAKFDGEHLATDLVDHGDSPEIGTELAWEIDKKTLRQHRLNRTPIKLQVYAVEPNLQQKELIGLVMIDLKKADQKPLQSQWYPLLNCSYHNSRPELRVGISVETEQQSQAAAALANNNMNKSPQNKQPKQNNELHSDGGAKMSVSGSPTISASEAHPARDGSSKHIAFSDQQISSNWDHGDVRMPGDVINNDPRRSNLAAPATLMNPELCQMIHNLVETAAATGTKSVSAGGPQGEATEVNGGAVRGQARVMDTSDLRGTSEYQVALELQLWKEQQQQLFITQLKKKEEERMKSLSEEWKRRDLEREVLMKQKLAASSELEEKLQKAIAQVEKREKLLVKNEAEFEQRKVEIVRDYEKKNCELTDTCARIEKDCVHKVELEKDKKKLLEDEISKLKQELNAAEKKLREREEEFEQFKQQLNLKPEVRLQAQINVLTLEKVELERKVETLTSSKAHYKQEWGRALKELFKLKQAVQSRQEAEMRKQQQQLEHMRLVHLAAEERKVAHKEKDEIEELKLEISKLKDMQSTTTKKGFEDHKANDVSQSNEELESHVTRLIEERDTLLRTGVYNSSDKIIVDLDKQIREAIAAKVS